MLTNTWLLGLGVTKYKPTSKPRMRTRTKEEQREYVREWKRLNADRCRKHTADYYKRNKDKILAKQRLARELSAERVV